MAIPGTDPDGDFYEEDEPLADVLAAWDRSAHTEHLTAPPRGITETLRIPDDLRSLEPLTEVTTGPGRRAA